MNGVSPMRAVPALDSFGSETFRDREVEPMPETKTRRTIKASKAHIARLKRQVKAEERRIALEQEASYLASKLEFLRKEKGESSYTGSTYNKG
jgi:hypothetical protein